MAKSVRNPVEHLNEHADFISHQPIEGSNPLNKPQVKESPAGAKLEYDPQYILQVRDLKKHFPIKDGMLSRVTGYVKAVDGVTFNQAVPF